MLHFASDADDTAFAVRNGGSIEQLHQLWHKPFTQHRTGLEQRFQILDELTGERVPDDGHPHCPRNWPCCLDTEFREYRFAQGNGLSDLDHDFLPFKLRRLNRFRSAGARAFPSSMNFNCPAWRTEKCHRALRSTVRRRPEKSPVVVLRQ